MSFLGDRGENAWEGMDSARRARILSDTLRQKGTGRDEQAFRKALGNRILDFVSTQEPPADIVSIVLHFVHDEAAVTALDTLRTLGDLQRLQQIAVDTTSGEIRLRPPESPTSS